jgi:hypothetical protein
MKVPRIEGNVKSRKAGNGAGKAAADQAAVTVDGHPREEAVVEVRADVQLPALTADEGRATVRVAGLTEGVE